MAGHVSSVTIIFSDTFYVLTLERVPYMVSDAYMVADATNLVQCIAYRNMFYLNTCLGSWDAIFCVPDLANAHLNIVIDLMIF